MELTSFSLNPLYASSSTMNIDFNTVAFDLAKQSAADRNGDIKNISKIIPDMIRCETSQEASELMTVFSSTKNRGNNSWLPEALMLFNTPGLSTAQKAAMVLKMFFHTECIGTDVLEPLVECNAKLGRYGFSFPQWRYLTQSFKGASLVERYGMTRLTRYNDVRYETFPDPARDEFGVGFFWSDKEWYVEYRRAYIVCSHLSGKDACTLVIRNNSYFFGRDRLPEPVYVSWDTHTIEELQQLSIRALEMDLAFRAWKYLDIDDQYIPIRNKASRAQRTLAFLDNFDNQLSSWLQKEGLQHFVSFLNSKLDGYGANPQRPFPLIGIIDAQMPPWFPQKVIPITADLIVDFENGKTVDVPPGSKLILLTDANGDFPLRPEVKQDKKAQAFIP